MNIGTICYNQKDNIAYFPIPKNCYTFFRNEFFKHKWQDIATEKSIGPETKLFSHSRNPRERFIKGITQILYTHFLPRGDINEALEIGLAKVLEEKDSLKHIPIYSNALLIAFKNIHVIPIPEYVHMYTDKITFIPLDHPEYSGNELTNRFLEKNNIDIKISELTNRANKSTKNKLKLYELVKQDIANKEIFYKEHIEPRLKRDIEIHNNSLIL